VLVGDDRTRSQRYADALTEIARRALTHTSPSGEPPHVLVVATPDQVTAARNGKTNRQPAGPAEPAGWAECAQTGPIDPGTLDRLSCDATLTRVLLAPDGGVLNLGRSVRTASPAQRKALSARDQGCVIPGCTATPSMCEAHHVTWFRHGGATDIANLALVCGHHHTAVHSGRGFKESSQHHCEWRCCGEFEQSSTFGSGWSPAGGFGGPATGVSAGGGSPVLAAGRAGLADPCGRGRLRRVQGGGGSVVPRRWRDAFRVHGGAVGPVSVVR
jgi:hypothetical protein